MSSAEESQSFAASVPLDTERVREQFDQFRDDFETLRQEIAKIIVGQDDIVAGVLIALIAGGHVLLEGVPGLGKTLLVRTLAEALHLKFQRIQFTPDLMPADLIGTNVVLETPDRVRKFEFQRGPVFANVLLADEINRATPKTQSALLEAMQEHSVTVAGVTYPLARPFFVLATQNPLEMEGTYPLPEAQLDRFLFKLLVRFPGGADIERILDRTTQAETPRATAVLDGERILELARLARQVPIAAEVRRYAVAVVLATHPENPQAAPLTKRFVRYGASPRGAQAMILAAKIRAVLDQRYHVACEDLRAVAHPALRHRLILNFEGQAENVQPDQVIDDVLKAVELPGQTVRSAGRGALDVTRTRNP
jgi:MoxR-like ATPase